MEVILKIPTSLDDITIEQFQKLKKIDASGITGRNLDDEILKLFTGIDSVGSISQKDRQFILDSVGKALVREGEFKTRFKLGYVELGMIPNFDKLSGDEYSDLINYSDSDEDLHRFMAVAYRPIKQKDSFKNYQIVKYSGTGELSELMKQMPMSIVNGFNGFFLTLSSDLEDHILKSTAEGQMKET